MKWAFVTTLIVFVSPPLHAAEKPAPRTARAALQACNDLVGTWRATGIPERPGGRNRKDFWTESVTWAWRFHGEDAWLTASFDKGKYFAAGELRYLPQGDLFQLTLRTTEKQDLVFTGSWKDRRLILDREDGERRETQRLVLSLLHSNRFLYTYEVRPADKVGFARLYQVGATKEGVPFATLDKQRECVVSGGQGTLAVTYQGKTYYVCCGGCRDAFKEDPEKYIKEYEAKKAAEKAAASRPTAPGQEK